MNLHLREASVSDLATLRKVLYEAVYWRRENGQPSSDDGLAAPGVRCALNDWGENVAYVGAIVHSAHSVFFAFIILGIVHGMA